MKYYILTITFFTLMFTTWAQPSDATVKARATRDGSSFMEFVGTGKIHTNLIETWYIRVAVTKAATEYPDIKYICATEYKYKKVGGSWSFDRTFHWWDEYEGIPNPSVSEAAEVLNKDLKKFLGGAYGDIVNEISPIRLAAEPRWKWHTMQSVEFIVETDFDRKVSSTEVTSLTQQYKVRFYADEFKGPWNSFLSLNHGSQKNHFTKTYSAEELREMPTLLSMDQENAAKAAIAHLPEVDVPIFSSAKELIVYTHNMLRTATRDEMHAYLLKTFSENLYGGKNTVQLSSWGDRRLNDILVDSYDGTSKYKDQFCEHPSVKHEQDNMMELWNKLENRHLRISTTSADGTFKISDIQGYIFVKAEDISAVEAGTKCGDPISTEVITLEKFSIGDKVEVMNRGSWKRGKVNKLDGRMADRYYVTFIPSGGVWINADQMRSSTGSNEEVTTSETTNEESTENPASTTKDKTKIKTNGRLSGLKNKIKIP